MKNLRAFSFHLMEPRNFKRRGNAMVISVILMVVLLGLGVIVGAVSLRDQIVQEYGDIAVGLDSLSQSYSYEISIDPDGPGGMDPTICSAEYIDNQPTLRDPGPNEAPADIMFIPQTQPDQREGRVDLPTGEFP